MVEGFFSNRESNHGSSGERATERWITVIGAVGAIIENKMIGKLDVKSIVTTKQAKKIIEKMIHLWMDRPGDTIGGQKRSGHRSSKQANISVGGSTATTASATGSSGSGSGSQSASALSKYSRSTSVVTVENRVHKAREAFNRRGRSKSVSAHKHWFDEAASTAVSVMPLNFFKVIHPFCFIISCFVASYFQT